jgi:hypothetical protein
VSLSRFRRAVVAIASAACIAAAFTGAAPALAQSTTPSVQASAKSAQIPKVLQAYRQQAGTAIEGACTDGVGFNNFTYFYRCTGDLSSSQWVASPCGIGEYNAITYYNVYGEINNCSTRVWVHQYYYPKFTDNGGTGFAYCFGPGTFEVWGTNLAPENIQVSANSAGC